MSIVLEPIGVVSGGRELPIDDDWGKSRAQLVLDASRFTPAALAGLSDFSHVEVIYYFHKVGDDEVTTGARHPRGRTDWPLVGIFAQRGKNRPNRIGVSTCRILSVQGLSVEVEGLDAIAGTPILDLKPVLAGFQPRGEFHEPPWATELMKDYW